MWSEVVVGALLTQQLFQAGGTAFYLIIGLCILLLTLLIERYWFLVLTYPRLKEKLLTNPSLGPRGYHQRARCCDLLLRVQAGIAAIKTLIALCPLVGLLGTVTGMILLFDMLAQRGTSDPALMSEGVARAILPTLAGMVVAVMGMLLFAHLEQWQKREGRALHELMERES